VRPCALGTYIVQHDRAARAEPIRFDCVRRKSHRAERRSRLRLATTAHQSAQQQLFKSALDPALKARLDSALTLRLPARRLLHPLWSAFGMFLPLVFDQRAFQGLCNQPGGGAVLSPAALERS